MSGGLPFSFESFPGVAAEACFEEMRTSSAHEEPWDDACTVKTTPMKNDVVTGGETETRLVHIMERTEGTWRHVESCEGDG
jgi:hypothetical protein